MNFDSHTKTLPPRPRRLLYKFILLDPTEPKTFCLGFDVKGAGLSWAFSAFYTNGKIEEITGSL